MNTRARFSHIFDFSRPVSLFACPAKVGQPNSTSRHIGPGFSIRCSNYEELRKASLEQDKRGNSWVALSGYHPKAAKQNSETVIGVKAFWHDIDVGEEEGKWPTQDAAKRALRKHCLEYKVPLPNVMTSSGGGIHIYWVLTEAIAPFPPKGDPWDVPAWKPAAEELKHWVKRDKIGADIKSTSNIAAVLRMPGTHNHKPQRGKALVEELAYDEAFMTWGLFEPKEIIEAFRVAGGSCRAVDLTKRAKTLKLALSDGDLKELMMDEATAAIFEKALAPRNAEKLRAIMDLAYNLDGDWAIVLERIKDGFLHGRWPMIKAVFQETNGADWGFQVYEEWCLEHEPEAIMHYKGDENARSLRSWRKRTWDKYKVMEIPDNVYAMGSVIAKMMFDNKDATQELLRAEDGMNKRPAGYELAATIMSREGYVFKDMDGNKWKVINGIAEMVE